MLVEKFCHKADGTLIKSCGSHNNRTEHWLLLPGFADSGVLFKPFGVFWMFDSFNCKFLTQVLSPFIKAYKASFITG